MDSFAAQDDLLLRNDKNRPFRVALVHPGERYGRDGKLVNTRSDALVEFYDMTAPGSADRFGASNPGSSSPGSSSPGSNGPGSSELAAGEGIFVSRYYAATLLESAARLRHAGLVLDAGIEEWRLSATNVATIIGWMRDQLTRAQKEQARQQLPRRFADLLRD